MCQNYTENIELHSTTLKIRMQLKYHTNALYLDTVKARRISNYHCDLVCCADQQFLVWVAHYYGIHLCAPVSLAPRIPRLCHFHILWNEDG